MQIQKAFTTSPHIAIAQYWGQKGATDCVNLFTIYFTIEVGGGRILSQSHITGPDPDSNYHLSLAVNGHLTSVQTLL